MPFIAKKNSWGKIHVGKDYISFYTFSLGTSGIFRDPICTWVVRRQRKNSKKKFNNLSIQSWKREEMFLVHLLRYLWNNRKYLGFAGICLLVHSLLKHTSEFPRKKKKIIISWVPICIRCLPGTYILCCPWVLVWVLFSRGHSYVAEKEDWNPVLSISKTAISFTATMWQLDDLNFKNPLWHENWYYIFMCPSSKVFWGTMPRADWQVGYSGTYGMLERWSDT